MSKFSEVELIPSLVATTDDSSDKLAIPNLTMIAIAAEITAEGGTAPTLTLFLQASDDGGISWYDIPHDFQLKTSTSGVDQTATPNKRNIFDVEVDATAKAVAIYKHMPFRDVRLHYIIGGSGSPTKTFSAFLVGK